MPTQLWQLKNLKSGVALNEPQPLPENWGPISGLENVADQLHDLSWVGMPDLGWFIVGELPPPPPEATREELIRQEAWDRLRDCDWTMLPDEPLNAEERAEWREHRAKLRKICRMKVFPADFQFPDQPRAPLSYPFQ